MNSLLKRQVRKFLPKELQSNIKLEKFLDAINRSYLTSEEQFGMLQRATTISSEELSNANEKLKQESDSQKEVILKLKKVINTLKVYDLEEENKLENTNLDSLELVDYIDNQTQKIIKINTERDLLLSSLERQNQELNDYTHLVSHDLKSPLQSIDALTTWVLEDYSDTLDSNGKENLQLIRENVEKMDILVNGILQYSTIDKIEKELYNINIDSLVSEILINRQKLNTITVNIPKKLPTIKGDRYRLEQLFTHLIDNAIKYNKKDAIIIEIGFEEKNDFWNFYIKDNGNGIAKKYFDKIFVAFQKIEDNFKSTGIGLSIVKKIIEVYKGKIYVESELEVGSTFYFSIKK